MARTNIHFNENRLKLIEIAYRLFLTNGYEDTSINDILKATGISRGAMYHYFASKEEILDMVIEYLMRLLDSQIELIVSNTTITALDKLERLLIPNTLPPKEILQVRELMKKNKKSLFFYLSKEADRQRTIPVITKIIEQGIKEGTFHTDYPVQMADYIYTVAQSLSDVFSINSKERKSKDLEAFIFLLQHALGMNMDTVLRLNESFEKVFLLEKNN